jgi:quercetin dioxygenase-like cupin family protein
MEPTFVRLNEVNPLALAEGITGQPLFGTGVMMNLVECAPGAVFPTHDHPHEQLGVVLSGSLTLIVDGEPHELGPMDAVALPGGVSHSAIAGADGAVMLDVFQPVRDDIREKAST